jgi:hypothetical protein
MATEPLLAALDMAVVVRRNSVRSSVLFDYWMLTKPEVNFLIAMATAAAFWLGCPKPLMDLEFPRNRRSRSSTRSSPLNPTAPEWDCGSAAPS